jgi:hypothetical protein
VSFANTRAADPNEPASSHLNDYMTSDRLRAWNEAADEVMEREEQFSGSAPIGL